MKRRKLLLFKYLVTRKKGGLAKIMFVTTVLALVGGWVLADTISKALLPPDVHQDLQHLRRNRSLRHYLDAIQVLIEPSTTVCDKQANVSLLVMVTSSPLHFEHRQAIRSTWAKHLPTYFILGVNGTSADDLLVDNYIEAKQYSDMIVYDFRDHYQNLTLKTALMLKWTLDRCPAAGFLLKTDDDVLVNPWTMRKVLEENANAPLIGYRKDDTRLHRDEQNKWYLPRWMHHRDRIPQYLSGTGYLINGKYIADIVSAALYEPLVNLEDIYFTYLVATRRLGWRLTHDVRLSPYKPWLPVPCLYWRLASAHSLGPEEMLAAWSGLSDLAQREKRNDEGFCHFYDITVLTEPTFTPCEGLGEVPLMVLVASAPAHYEHRDAVRATWAQHYPTFFVLGLSQPGDVETIYLEAKQYNDLIVYDFRDHYQNLTLKTALMVNWSWRRCPRAGFLLKTDDDVLVNPWMIETVLQNHSNDMLIGCKFHNVRPIRNEYHKWYLPRWLYQSEIVPQYLRGNAYLLNGKYIKKILDTAVGVPLINLEDIYFTYLVSSKAGLELTHDPRFSAERPLPFACAYWAHATSDVLGPQDMRAKWSDLEELARDYKINGDVCSLYRSFFSAFSLT